MSSPTLRREERKVVTALFADLVGSTALGERLDPEDAYEIVQGAIAHVIEAVESFGGLVQDLAGDGLLALFGAPTAREDDAERAVRAGLAIVEDFASYAANARERFDVPGLGIRVGVETGLVVLGTIGAGSRVEYGATGDALNTAARLQGVADPGTVAVGEATFRLVRERFHWGPAREVELKGKAKPIRVTPALRAAEVSSGPGSDTGTTMIGRDAEIGLAAAAVDALWGGRGGAVFVTGEPGIGKSRMLLEVRRLQGSRGGPWIEGRCRPLDAATPFAPFRGLLRGLVTPAGGDDRSVRAALAAMASGRGLDARAEALLADLLTVTSAEDRQLLSPLSPDARQFGIVEALVDLLVALSMDRPLVVGVEDLHWADATSLVVTERIHAAMHDAPILLIAASRPEPGTPSLAMIERAASADPDRTLRIHLDTLAPGSDLLLLDALTGPGVIPAIVADRLRAAAGGNPFHLEELVRSLIDAGALARDGPDWRFVHDAPIEVPASLSQVLVARIDRLDEGPRSALTAASVLGRRFSVRLLARVSGATNLEDNLGRLVEADLVRPAPDDVGFTFKHALIQEAAYGTLLRRKRRELHALAAAAIVEEHADDLEEHLGDLAVHHRGAGELEAAIDCHRRAADRALTISALPEALRHLDDALAIASELGWDDARVSDMRLARGRARSRTGAFEGAFADLDLAAAAGADPYIRMRAESELGFALAGAADYRRGIAHLDRALAAATDLGDTTAEVEIRARSSIVHTNLLQLARAVEEGSAAVRIARDLGDDGAIAMALDAIELAAVTIGDFPTAETVAEELRAIHGRRGDLWLLQYAVYQSCWRPIATCRWDEAIARLAESEEIARSIGDRGPEPMYLSTRAWIDRCRGRYANALAEGTRAVALADELAHAEWQGWTRGLLGAVLLELGDADGAAQVLVSGLEAADRSGSRIQQLRCAGLLARAHLELGDLTAAGGLARRAHRLWSDVSAPAGRTYLQGADAAIALARVLETMDGGVGAKIAGDVLRAARTAGWAEVVAQAAFAVGSCLRAVDRPAAITALSEALDIATSNALPGMAWRAHAGLSALGVEPERNARSATRIVGELQANVGDASIAPALHRALASELESWKEGR